MTIDGWRYYNHAAIPTCSPHDEPDLTPVKNGKIWKMGGMALLARWTSNWDCGHETNWWYVIKDTPFNISELKSKRRYEINKGIKNFDVRLVDPENMADDFYKVTVSAYSGWPEKYRPSVTKEQTAENIKLYRNNLVLGAFDKGSNLLEGYAVVEDHGSYAAFSILRTNPDREKHGINAAIVYGMLMELDDRLKDGFYI